MSWAMARHVTRRLMPHLLDPGAEGVAARTRGPAETLAPLWTS